MSYNWEPTIINGHNYGIWEQYMEMLKNKVLFPFTKIVVLDSKYVLGSYSTHTTPILILCAP